MKWLRFWYILLLVLVSCSKPHKRATPTPVTHISTGSVTPGQVIAYAQSLKGVPYKYGSTDPAKGFDCSGFITYVFKHFGIAVPRQSVDFTAIGRGIDLNDASPDDLVLFTGSDSTTNTVGHMGIIVSSPGEAPLFIHSTSGKARGVTETPFYTYYIQRYMKTIRIFPQNDRYPGTAGQCLLSPAI
jgi:cell wall-associated NlpC family hydrolase